MERSYYLNKYFVSDNYHDTDRIKDQMIAHGFIFDRLSSVHRELVINKVTTDDNKTHAISIDNFEDTGYINYTYGTLIREKQVIDISRSKKIKRLFS